MNALNEGHGYRKPQAGSPPHVMQIQPTHIYHSVIAVHGYGAVNHALGKLEHTKDSLLANTEDCHHLLFPAPLNFRGALGHHFHVPQSKGHSSLPMIIAKRLQRK